MSSVRTRVARPLYCPEEKKLVRSACIALPTCTQCVPISSLRDSKAGEPRACYPRVHALHRISPTSPLMGQFHGQKSHDVKSMSKKKKIITK